VPPPNPGLLALPIQLLAGGVIAIYLAAALVAVARTGSLARARLTAADGVIAGLGLLAAATLVRMIELHTWDQIALLTVVLTLRTLVKWLFAWERRRIIARQSDLGLRRPP
jgi:cell division protein FtsW (lipid II flippase)